VLLSAADPVLYSMAEPATSADLSPPFTPAQIRQAYGLNNVFFGSTPGLGQGQTIAIIDVQNDPFIVSDVNTFDSDFGVQAFNVNGGPTFTVENESGTVINPGNPNDPNLPPNITLPAKGQSAAAETALDVEWAHSVAPEANIVLFEANTSLTSDLFNCINLARNIPGVSVVSMSWGGGEFSGENSYDSTLTTPAGHQGVSFFFDTGDGGGDTGYPSFSPNGVAVGGTSLTINADGSYGGETAWSGSAGGISTQESQPFYQDPTADAYTNNQRAAPDVSWLANPNTGVAEVDSLDSPGGVVFTEGGTSLATPMWAALIAIVDQGRVLNGLRTLDGATQLLPKLYSLPYTDFNDITSGSNSINSAGPGYDLVTGLGSPNVVPLVQDLSSNIVYVDANSPGPTHDGSSWFYAYQSLSQALQNATPPETIEVAEGTYFPGLASSQTFQLIDNVTIQGGFAGALDPQSNYDPSVFTTTLTGLLPFGGASTNVVTGSGTNSSAVLEGVTISGGQGGTEGGGLYDDDGSPTLNDCIFEDDSADNGGAVYDLDSSPSFNTCVFEDNSAVITGGAIADVDSSPSFSACAIIDNSAIAGGGMDEYDSSPTISSTFFISNSANVGGGLWVDSGAPNLSNDNIDNNTVTATGSANSQGGGMYITDSSPVISGCSFISNTASTSGSTVPSGGGIYDDDASPTITDCTFTDNSATVGGGITDDDSSSPTITDTKFSGNTSTQFGGGMYNENTSTAIVVNSTFSSNSSGFGGGVDNLSCDPIFLNCLFSANSSTDSGAAVDNSDASPDFINCTFTENTGSEVGTIASGNSSVILQNCVMWNDSAATSVGEIVGSAASVTYSDIQGGYAGSGNVNANPVFVSGSDFELQPGSPCINVGNNLPIEFAEGATGVSVDLAGAPRISAGTVDMGAYEAQLYYVDESAPGSNNGSSWSNAYTSLSIGLFAAALIELDAYAPNTVPIHIYVAQGNYDPYTGSNTSTFSLLDNVTLAGGYAGHSNPNAAPNVGLYPTILDGNSSVYHVVTASGTNSTAVLDGFTITGGSALGGGDAYSPYGGGMIIINGSPTIENCVFTHNNADFGGAIYNGDSSPLLVNCAFDDNAANTSSGVGGAIDDAAASSPTLINCTIDHNSADLAGGIDNVDNSVSTLTNCIVWNNLNGQITNTSSDVDDSSAMVSYSDVQGGYGGTNNINSNPLFVSDGSNLQLQDLSPAINRGNNAVAKLSTDAAGNPRIVAGTVDMGAYEYQGPFVIYVDQSATHGLQNGTSWANAFTNLAQALAAASSGYTIEVAQGTYVPGSQISEAGNTFQLISGVTIQGGYATGGSATPQPSVNVTYLDGDGIDYSVVNATGVSSTAVLNGFTIENGNAPIDGGGMFNAGGSPTIIDCVFMGNKAAEFGGAVDNENNANATFINCLFTDNSAEYGGAVANSDSIPNLINCAFYFNNATYGGGVYNTSASTDIVNCTFTENDAQYGGAIADLSASPDLNNDILWNDKATSAGSEIYTSGSAPLVGYSDVDQSGFAGANNDIDADPMFIGFPDLQLQNFSPCYNTGSTSIAQFVEAVTGITTDLAGAPRIAFGAVDMGAYEYQGPTSLVFAPGPSNVTVNTALPTMVVDLEQNGQIDKNDNSKVTLSIANTNAVGAVLSGQLVVSAVAGQATFTGISLNAPGTYELEATDGTDTAAVSGFFSVTAVAVPTKLVFGNTFPGTLTTGQAISNPPVIVYVQQNGVTINDNSTVGLAINNDGVFFQTQAINGTATFTNVEFAIAGTFTLTAVDGTDIGATSTPIVVNVAPAPINLVFSTPPATITAGSTIAPPITVTETQNGITVNDSTSFVTLTLTSAPTGGTLNGTYIEKLVNGVATFSNLEPNAVGAYVINAVDDADTSAQLGFSAALPVRPDLVFTEQPASFALGSNIPVPTFQVSVEVNGVVQNVTDAISVIVAIPNDDAYTPRTVNAVDGVATFSNFFVGSAANTTLEAFDTTNTNAVPGFSQLFVVSPGPAVHFEASGSGIAGSTTTITVDAYDVLYNFTPGYFGQVTLTILDSNNNVIDTLMANANAGVATFNVVIDQAANYQLQASDSSIGASGSGGLLISAASPAQVQFIQQPSVTSVNYPIQPAITVAVEDQFGNIVTTDSSSVTLSIATPSGYELGGSITVDAQSGIATFGDVTVPQPGTFTLQATDGGLTPNVSAPFQVYSTAIYYVDQSATAGADTGLDWPDAFLSLQSALAVAVPGDTIDVAQGDYSPGTDPTSTFQLLNGVTIQGGFPTGGASSPDPIVYPTLLDGMNANFHVVTGNGNNSTAVLNGFTILNGNANGTGDADSSYGGGLVADGGVPTIINCIFQNNTAIDGGAMYTANEGTAGPNLVDCLFFANTAQYGGALYTYNCSPTLTNCTFTANSVTEYGGAIESDDASDPVLINCILWNDTSYFGDQELSNDQIYLGYSYSIVAATYSDIDGGYVGVGNINTDPQFVNAASNNFQLQVSSPCVNEGSNAAPALAETTADLAENPRISGGIVDMGAYEVPLGSAVIYVDQHATGTDNGQSWANAFTSLTAALAVTLPGDTVEVAQGDYSPGTDPTDTFQIMDLVTIQGGYPTGGASIADPSAYPTILDGMNVSYHVLTYTGSNNTAVLNGFTITGGNADGAGDANSGFGGGMFVNGGEPTITDCIFTDNSAVSGGAMYNLGASPLLINCLFDNNEANGGYGGAMDNYDSSPTITNCTFSANGAALYGGAIENDADSIPVLTNCILWGDVAGYGFNEIADDLEYGYSGSVPVVSNCDIEGGTFGGLDADPLFENPSAFNFQIQPTSPCINAGDNGAPGLSSVSTDLAGNPRIVDGIVDIGAYESQSVDVYFTGEGDGYSWSDPNNWSDLLVPTQHDNVTIASYYDVEIYGDSFASGPLIDAGALEITSGSSLQLFGPTTFSGSLTVDPGGTLDVQSNTVMFDYAAGFDPAANLVSYLTTGYSGGAWNGTGIISSTVAAENASQSKLIYSVGYADGADGIVAGLTSGEFEIMPTLSGDAKLQGNVVFGDFQLLSQYFGQPGSWDEGNFTYNSVVNFGDFQLLSQNFGQAASLPAAANGSSPSVGSFAAKTAASGSTAIVVANNLLSDTDADASILDGTWNGVSSFSDIALDL
jgi:hypothetical protein